MAPVTRSQTRLAQSQPREEKRQVKAEPKQPPRRQQDEYNKDLKFKIVGAFIMTNYKTYTGQPKVKVTQHPITCIEITYPANVWLNKKEQSFVVYTSPKIGYSLQMDNWYPSAVKALEDYRIFKENSACGSKPAHSWRRSVASALQEFMEMSQQ